MVACRQLRDEGCDFAGVGIDDHDTRAVVLALRVSGLVRIGRKQPTALSTALESYIHRGSCGLKAAAGRWLAESPQQFSSRIEHENVRRERIRRIEVATPEIRLLVAAAR